MEYIVRGNYYVDIDNNHQLRITGPGNHLLCGISLPTTTKPTITHSKLTYDTLTLTLELDEKKVTTHLPLVTDIRTLRSLTEPIIPTPLYTQLAENYPEQVMPEQIKEDSDAQSNSYTFTNSYHDGADYTYGCRIFLSNKYASTIDGNILTISSQQKPLKIKLQTISNITVETLEDSSLFQVSELDSGSLDPRIYDFYEQSGQDIDHLVRTKKTSSFEYGTIFPRDWIEAADLGEDDFTQKTFDYMYEQSMKYVNDKGEGWHEEIIGQYKTKTEHKSDLVDRKMIDIEPHYILGMSHLSSDFLNRSDIHTKFIAIAQFVIHNAQEQNLISFKRQKETDGYYLVGNWRDSEKAFYNQKSPLSPYDVNCVFYPEALRHIKTNANYLQIDPHINIDELITKWDRNKQKFRLYHADNLIGYSLALHGKKNLPMPVAHIDESYDLFYNRPSIEEVDSFARKVIDPDYFYTPAGPILVESDARDYSTKQYHGKVIWPKQVAFVVAGLGRQLRYAQEHAWPEVVRHNISDAIITTAEASFYAWRTLDSIPELYYFDDHKNKARLYTDQKDYEGQMSLVQLWSAVGARRIIREYLNVKTLTEV